jgi:alanine racemase
MHQADLRRANPVLGIDLGAICENSWDHLVRVRGTCGAVVKADAYGLGAAAIVPALHAEGAPGFFGADLMRLFSSIGKGLH